MHKVLFVDDEPDFNKYSRAHCARYFDVVTVESAAEAIELLRNTEDPFLAIVTDYKMGGSDESELLCMDGLELLCLVEKEFPDLSRVLVTGYYDAELIPYTERGTIQHVMSKPVKWTDQLIPILKGFAEKHD